MHKKVLVCLPLNDAHRAALEASVPEFEFRFNALDDVHAEDVLWADVVLGNAPVSMISQNKHIEWFQSNSAGPDAYLKPGVLPENCMVTNATGAYGLAISEWMLAMWLGIQKDMFLYRDRQNQRQWAPIDRPVRGITGARVLCVGMGDIGSNFARRAHMLGAEVVGVRRTVHPDTPCPDYCLRVVAQSQLDEELPEADLIALSLPGTPETNKLFNAERFARCKDGAILINVGRGTTVDSDALVEALRSGRELECIYIQSGSPKGPVAAILNKAREQGIPVKEATREKLTQLSGIETHQGVAAICAAAAYAEMKDIYERAGEEPLFVVICDNIEDPHNLGAIIRTAEACGAHGVIIPKRHSAGLTAAAVKSSAGAAVCLPVVRVANIVATMQSLKAEKNVWFTCADMDGVNWCQLDFKGAVGLVIGSEGNGVSRLVKEECDFVAALPMQGQINSLNASVAGGIILYEITRQRLGLKAR